VPLLAGGRVLGALTCLRLGVQAYDEPDLSLATDLAHRVALAADNVGLYQAAQHAIKDRDEFLSVAAHELKTPITSLRGYAQLALRRLDGEDGHSLSYLRKPLEVIVLQSTKLTRLVGQLLDTSRLEAGKLTLTRERVDLVAVVRSLVERTRMLSDQHTVILEAPETAMADIDQVRIEQVLTNLLDNAIKYSPQGGLIRVALSTPTSTCIRLSIQDQGVGIPQDRREHIFERFYQAHGELLPAMAGMGLGLYISRQIVELHQGSIDAEFPPEGGVRFVILLPTDGGAG
jgi:signal transduction histidine kinase